MEKKNKTALKITAGGLIVALAGMAGGAMLFPVEKEVIVPVHVPGETKYVTEFVDVPGPVQFVYEEREVLVDNGNLQLVLEEIYDADGDVSYLTAGLDDDELDMIVERIVFQSEAKIIAENAVKSKAFSELHRDDSTGTRLHKDDMRGLKLDSDDTVFDVIDFDDKDAEVLVKITFRQGSERFEAVLSVLVRDGEYDDIAVESVTKL
jgi:hypothetical protein